MHIHTYVAILYAHKRIISHPNRIWFFFLCTVLSLILFTWQHTSAFQMSKQASSQLGSTDAEHLVRSVGLEEPGQGGSAAPQRQQEQAGTLWDGMGWEIYHAVALFQKSTSWWTNDWETHWLIRDYWSHHLRSEGDRWPHLVLSHFRMDTPSSPVTAFLLTVWRQWTATAGCWDAPQASSDMLVSMGPAGRAGGWEGTERGLRDFPSSPGSWKPSSGCSLWFSGPQNKVYSQKHFSSMSCVSGNVQKKAKPSAKECSEGELPGSHCQCFTFSNS